MTCTPREKGGEEGFDPSHLAKLQTSIVLAIVACWSTSFPTPFPTFVVVCVPFSYGSGALITVKLPLPTELEDIMHFLNLCFASSYFQYNG